MDIKPGQVLNNRYRILSLLAQGGFGAVYLAEDLNLGTRVAVKENLSTSEESVRQFNFEAKLLATLRHEHLPFVIDYFSLPQQGQYLVMEFIEGEDLQSWLERGPLPEARMIPIFEQVCDALAYLHAQHPPVIHRDIKPANIKITPSGKVKLVDFGIAKVYSPSKRTTVGARAVTQGFSPPEQYGRGGTDVRSDIYALGATLYAALTGEVPVDGLQRQLGTALRPPRGINPSISPNIEAVILRAMAMNPQDRYQTVMEFKAALRSRGMERTWVMPTQREAKEAIVLPSPSPEAYAPEVISVPAVKEKRPWLAFLAGALIVICLLGGIGVGVGWVMFRDGFEVETTTSQFDLLAQTSTALAMQLMVTVSPTASRTPTVPHPTTPSPSFTPLISLTPSFTPTPSPTMTPLIKPTWYPCANTYPSRLHVGDRAKVSEDPPYPNRVRSQPNTSSDILGLLEVGEMMEIIGGPVCSQGWIWWEVRSLEKNLSGWTAEGDGKDYWLVPVP